MEVYAPESDETLAYLVDDYLSDCAARNLSKATTRLYQFALNRFLRFSGALPPAAVTERTLRRFIFDMQSDGLSARTVRHYALIVCFFLKYIHREGFIVSNPAADFTLPREGRRLPHFLNEEQSQALLDACPDWTWFGLRDKTAIFLLLGTGLRFAEMLALDLSDVDLATGEVRVIGKGNKERSVSMDDDVIAALKLWLDTRYRILGGRPQSALFISRSGGRMGKTFGQSVKAIGKRAGFYCTPHVCRHTYATNWIRGGGDSVTLKEMLGHSHISITEGYIHLARKDFKQAANQYSITRKLRFDSRQMSLL